jgi:hypothetical protein
MWLVVSTKMKMASINQNVLRYVESGQPVEVVLKLLPGVDPRWGCGRRSHLDRFGQGHPRHPQDHDADGDVDELRESSVKKESNGAVRLVLSGIISSRPQAHGQC